MALQCLPLAEEEKLAKLLQFDGARQRVLRFLERCRLAWDELPSIIREHRVDIGIVAVNAEAAQTVYDAFADAGLNAVLNFAPTQLRSRPGVKVKSVDLRINLESLSFYLKIVEDGGT